MTVVYPGGNVGLDGVSLTIERGEFAFLVGATGCGKSHLHPLLLREIDASRGQVLIAGRDIGALPRKKVPKLRRNIGTVFQDYKLLPNRTVYDNVAYSLQVIGESRSEHQAKVPEILRLVGLSTKLNDYPDELSGGEQQRVSLARAFVNHPPLLLADEPTGNLDPETSMGIMQLLYRMNRTGTTVIVATHDNEMVDRMRRRVIEMSEGRVVRDEAGAMYLRRAMRPVFFLREALRALRRNAAPSLAAFATVLITTLVLGVFIPVVRAATAKTNEVRNKIELEVFINDDATKAEVRELGNMIRDIRHVESIDYVSKAEALRILRAAARRQVRRSPRTCPATRCRGPTASSSTTRRTPTS